MSGNAYYYRKVGKLCYLQSVISGFSDTSTGNALSLTGAPFSPDVNGQAVGTSMANYVSANKSIAYIQASGNILFYADNTSGNYSPLTHGDVNSNTSIHLFITYQTA